MGQRHGLAMQPDGIQLTLGGVVKHLAMKLRPLIADLAHVSQHQGTRNAHAGQGINGQHVFVDRSTQTVIAQQSTTPFPLDTHLMLFGTDVVMRVLDRFA